MLTAEGLRGPLLLWEIIGIEVLGTFGAEPVTELRIGMFHDIHLDHLPVPFVVPYLFAFGADRQDAAQLFEDEGRDVGTKTTCFV
jgi:hypothetical protein